MVCASILNLKEPLCHLSHLLASGCSASWNLNFLKFNKKFKHSKEIACNGKDYSSSANSNLLWMYLKHFWITKYLILLGSSYLMFTINSIIHFSYFFFFKFKPGSSIFMKVPFAILLLIMYLEYSLYCLISPIIY